MPLLGSRGAASVTGFGGLAKLGYLLRNSLRFRSSASAYLNRTLTTPTDNIKWTFSCWFKRGEFGNGNGYTFINAGGAAGGAAGEDYLTFIASTGSSMDSIIFAQSNASTTYLLTTPKYRDPSAWYHLVFVYDSANATSSNRALLYINGVQVTAFSTATYPTLSLASKINSAVLHRIGSRTYAVDGLFDGYMTEINFVDGQALTPSSFGKTDSATGQWLPIKYSGTYGTNGFYLPFTNTTSTSTLGNDFSGNSNTWTVNNISLTAGATYDSMTDVPTLTNATTANYATLNPTVPKTYCTQTDGNLKSAGTSSTDSDTSVATIGVSSGKWYWEDKIGTISSAVYPIFGAGRNILSSFIGKYPGDSSVGGLGIVVGNGNIVREGSTVTTVTALVANDVVGFALDLGALTCAIYKNNSLIYTVTGLTAGTYYPMANEYSSSNSTHNYGQQPFAYTPPTGFVALNTFNI